MAKLQCVTIDCDDAEGLARFWGIALEGYTTDEEWKVLLKSDSGPMIFFQKVPEPKNGKNRVHLDMQSDNREAEVFRLSRNGARVLEEKDEHGHRWTIMQDPEGNEFCVTQTSG
jgi:predicted enzyme related to lactoylglutathione lyase